MVDGGGEEEKVVLDAAVYPNAAKHKLIVASEV